MYVPSRVAREQLGVTDQTLRRWATLGIIKHIHTPGGNYLFDVQSFITSNSHQEKTEQSEQQQQKTQETPKRRVCYCRVSSVGQSNDLKRQVSFMRDKYPDHDIITDIGSGINFKRKGLRSILELAFRGMLEEVVVAYRDRLCRFAFELVEWILSVHRVRLVVLDSSLDTSPNSELAEDLLAIIQVFNCRANGRRKYQNKTHEDAEDEADDSENTEERASTKETICEQRA